MKVLVAGGAGYIGSHTVRRLRDAGHEPTVYDNLCAGHRGAVKDCRLIEGDIGDGEALRSAFAETQAEAVIHFAAFLSVAESVEEPAKYFRNNVANTITLLDAMRDADVSRIVFSSSAAVYGVPSHCPIEEEHPKRPINPYGLSKLQVEQILAEYARAYGLAAVALRYFNAAGASPAGDIGEDHDPEPHLIPIILQVALGQREKVFIYGSDYDTPDGTCLRDYIHVDDLADAHVLAMEKAPRGEFRAYNLGNGTGYSVRDVIEQARAVTGHPIPAEDAPRRPGDPPALVASSSKAVEELGWKPQLAGLDQIIGTAWRWHKAHPRGYDD